MNKLLLISGLVLPFSAGALIELSRDVFGAAGTEFTNANMQASFTIGETFTATLTNSEIHTLGFQQTKQSTVSVVELSSVEVGLYPNPADDQITFVEEPFTNKKFDVTGRIFLEGSYQQSLLTLNVTNLVEGK